MNKLDDCSGSGPSDFRLLLESNCKLLNSTGMGVFTTDAIIIEENLLKTEIETSTEQYGNFYFSLAFDSTSRFSEECFNVVMFFNLNGRTVKRLIYFKLFAETFDGEQVASVLVSLLFNRHINLVNCVALMHDRVSSNYTAISNIIDAFKCSSFQDLPCYSHTLDNSGKRLNSPQVKAFTEYYIALFSHSVNTKNLFQKLVGANVRSYSETRWWSWLEVLEQVLDNYDIIKDRLIPEIINRNWCPNIVKSVELAMDNSLMLLHLTAFVEFGMHLVKATYILEGDSTLAWDVYDLFSNILNLKTTWNCPRVEAVAKLMARSFSNDIATIELKTKEYITEARSVVLTSIEYLESIITGDEAFKKSFYFYKTCRLLDPMRVRLCINENDFNLTEQLKCVKFLSKEDVVKLVADFPTFVAYSDSFKPPDDYENLSENNIAAENRIAVQNWYHENKARIPKSWFNFFIKCCVARPSSGAPERVFSLYEGLIQDNQGSMLEDMKSLILMLRYNDR